MRSYSKIFEMSVSKKRLEEIISQLQFTINEHLFKILIFNSNRNLVKKWNNEISANLNNLQKYRSKHNNGFLTKEQYFNLLYTEPLDNSEEVNKGDKLVFYTYVNDLISNYSEIQSLYSKNNFPFDEWNKKIYEFYKQICILLSDGELTRDEAVKILIKEIL